MKTIVVRELMGERAYPNQTVADRAEPGSPRARIGPAPACLGSLRFDRGHDLLAALVLVALRHIGAGPTGQLGQRLCQSRRA